MKQNLMKETKKINSTVVENSRYFYIGDHLGSSAWVCDYQGNPLQHLRYYPYGEILLSQKASGSTYDSPYQYVGNEYDSESGYNNMNARYYWSNLGMFLSVDKMCDKYPMFTPYNYAGNNPIMYKDPTGFDIDPATEKNVSQYVNPKSSQYNAGFAQKYDVLKNDHNAVYSFNDKGDAWIEDGARTYGSVSYNGTNDNGQYLIGINYADNAGTSGLSSQSPLLEETFHATQFSNGDFGFLSTGGTIALDMHDEAAAKVWAAQNTQTTKYKFENNLLDAFEKGGLKGAADFLESKSNIYNSLKNTPRGINVVEQLNRWGNSGQYFKSNGQSIFPNIIMQRPK